jgi:hypothetical protein
MELSGNRILSAHQAKVAKALPHLFPQLCAYKYLLYVDDKISFSLDSMKLWLSNSVGKKDWAIKIRKHPSLTGNILHEFGTAMIQPRYQAQRDQTTQYITHKVENGYKLDVECLYWTSAILRNMQHPDTIKINEQWYEDILSCGIECQIAFDFVAQRFNSIQIMPEKID